MHAILGFWLLYHRAKKLDVEYAYLIIEFLKPLEVASNLPPISQFLSLHFLDFFHKLFQRL